MDIDYVNRECLKLGLLEKIPIFQFHKWFIEIKHYGIKNANVAVLSTVNYDNHPFSRAIMIKAYDKKGFIFFTECKTNKVFQIRQNSNVALLFLWLELERQVKILGVAQKLTIPEAFSYFSNRGNKIGCWIKENGVLNPRLMLEKELGELITTLYKSRKTFSDIFCAYRVIPNTFEFWQVCEDKLYQNFLYEKIDNSWSIKELS